MRTLFICLIFLFACPFVGAQWVQTNGPLAGGSVSSMIIAGENILAGTNQNGVFISTDVGASWHQVNYNFAGLGPRQFIISGEYILVGTDAGIYRSADGGFTWAEANIGMPSYRSIGAMIVNGTNIIAGTAMGSYFVSTNNGESWLGVSLAQPAPAALAVCNGDLFAGTFGHGVLRSTDNAITWTEFNIGLSNLNVQTLAVSGTNIFAGTFGGGVYVTTYTGSSWNEVNTGLPDLTIDALAISGINIYAATRGGVFRSINNGSSWTGINNGLPAYVWVMTIMAAGSNIYAGLDSRGVYFSENSGNSWRATSGLPCANVKSMTTSNSSIFAGTAGQGLFKSTDNGNVWSKSGEGIPDWVSITALAVNGNTLFAGTSEGLFTSSDDGSSWVKGILGSQIQAFAIKGNTILAAVYWGGVYMSTDNGNTWNQINNGLPNRPVNAVIFSGSTIFAGTDGNGIYRSVDNGNSWIPVNSGLTNQLILSIAVIGSSVFAGTDGGLFVTTNNGSLWTQLRYGSFRALAVSGSTLFASTYSGASMSTDNGGTWMDVNEGLVQLIYAFVFSGTNVFAATSGSGVFINQSLLTGTDDEIATAQEVCIYPNPAVHSITLETNDIVPEGMLHLYNISGQQVIQHQIKDYLTTINISSLPAGLYIVRYGNGLTERTGRFIKD